MASVYGQPDGEYDLVESPYFAESVRIAKRYYGSGGYKLHISVDVNHAESLARVMLPTLRLLNVYHKVVTFVDTYERLNLGEQRGKFITIYAGPYDEALRIVNVLSPTLLRLKAEGVKRGPVPLARKANHQQFEKVIDPSGMISAW